MPGKVKFGWVEGAQKEKIWAVSFEVGRLPGLPINRINKHLRGRSPQGSFKRPKSPGGVEAEALQ
jgi:hypothetical protein